MKTLKLLLIIGVISLSVDAIAQEEGTYYIEVLGRAKPLIPSNINEIVAENRKEKTENVYYLGTHVRLRILSKEEIESANFSKIERNIINLQSF